ncbi:glycyl-radical enzyme activating protein [Peptacetobacter hominis]|uniref:Glycyl-radical enzyme activating protein n=1 Tax=Peptacetobacter hominis TaxID=2743610 RepID=A0A544QY41_9FIRM|nr:glycyl-radical enzyme activating protein [Peptacetobacter hominis]TQQ85657.1 glycyl-radical enzyme activating protein [Peptacetobacter hominis]
MINVFNIEKFAIHDGPGIRTTVFLKGCPLHCPWCSNPESLSLKPVFMHDERKCTLCGRCMEKCESNAISISSSIENYERNNKTKELFVHDTDKCILCGKCEKACLNKAISIYGKYMEIEEIVDEVMKDIDYYESSGGGVTISGGEPFIQFDEFMELIKILKKKGLHVAVETTGNYSKEKLKKAEPYIDLFLFDIKHIDEEKLKSFTGADKNTVVANLKEIPVEKLIMRVPVIPGFNSSEKDIKDIIEFGHKNNVKIINLLPFHPFGTIKWQQMGKVYQYENIPIMNKSELEKYKEYGKSMGIDIKIGG